MLYRRFLLQPLGEASRSVENARKEAANMRLAGMQAVAQVRLVYIFFILYLHTMLTKLTFGDIFILFVCFILLYYKMKGTIRSVSSISCMNLSLKNTLFLIREK